MPIDDVDPESVCSLEMHRLLGAVGDREGRCRFCVWAPHASQLQLELVGEDRVVPMQKLGDYHLAVVDQVPSRQRYGYRIDGGPRRPDPASRSQPDGVHGPSQVIDSAYGWSDHDWSPPARDDLVIYELHIGAFTEAGTFVAAIERLDELVQLGVNAIELMPVAQAAGRWNWGYDGVGLFAPQHSLGSGDGLRRLVNAAHAKGLAVILDVVYNHLGPEGNYWSEFGPYLSDRHNTAWGAAPNFDCPRYGRAVRRFFVANVIHWLDEYHIDGLRIDAIHCMRDDSDYHIVTEIAESAHQWSQQVGRPIILIAETNLYDQQMVSPISQGGHGFDAQWCDDFLHSLFAVVQPDQQLCHRPYRPGNDLSETLAIGCVYEGSVRSQRGRSHRRERVDTHGMIYSIQNHDFIGNHPLGQRFAQLTSIDTQAAAATLLMLAPAIPMLFMGEEFACRQPFRFFVDFSDQHLRRAVVKGRRREYPQHDWSAGVLPTDPQAFYQSKIGPPGQGNATLRRWYQALIECRKRFRSSGLLSDGRLTVDSDVSSGLFHLHYQDGSRCLDVAARLVANPARPDSRQPGTAQPGSPDPCPLRCSGQLLLDSRPGATKTDMLLPNHGKVFFSE